MSIQVNGCQQVKASQVPLEELASNSQCSSGDKLAEVSRQFEAILLRQIFTEAQKPVFQSKYSAPSVAGDIYKDLITNQLADEVSRSGSFGLARGLEKQLQHQLKTGEEPQADQSSDLAANPAHQRTTPKRYD